ncbi:MAG: polysaccharide biosynthesis C-terminal domain-containing protein [Anaerolineaceae bacterium]
MKTWLADVFESPEIATAINFTIPGLIFFSLNKVLLSYLNGLSRIKDFALFQSGRYFYLIISLIIIIALKTPPVTLTVIFTISEFFLFLTMLFKLPEIFQPVGRDLLSSWIRRHLSFGLRGFLSNVLLDLNTRIDILILGYLTSDAVVGVYSLAIVVIEGLYQIPIALRVNYAPVIVSLIKKEAWDELKATVGKGSRITWLVMAGIGLASVIVFPYSYLFLGNQSEFLQSWTPFIILVLGLVLASGYLPYSNIILQAGFPGIHTLMILFLVLLNLILNFIFASKFGAVGSAFATSLSLVAIIPLLKIFTRKTINLKI